MTLVSRHAQGTTYRGSEAADLAGITFRQLDYWVRTGAVVPTVEAHGSGSRRRFSLDDIVLMAVGGALGRLGARHIQAVRALGGTDLCRTEDRIYLGPHAHWATDPAVFRAMDDAETVVLVDLARIRARVAGAATVLVTHRSGRDDLEASR